MKLYAQKLYELYVQSQLLLNNCTEPTWEELDVCDKLVWDLVADHVNQLFGS